VVPTCKRRRRRTASGDRASALKVPSVPLRLINCRKMAPRSEQTLPSLNQITAMPPENKTQYVQFPRQAACLKRLENLMVDFVKTKRNSDRLFEFESIKKVMTSSKYEERRRIRAAATLTMPCDQGFETDLP